MVKNLRRVISGGFSHGKRINSLFILLGYYFSREALVYFITVQGMIFLFLDRKQSPYRINKVHYVDRNCNHCVCYRCDFGHTVVSIRSSMG